MQGYVQYCYNGTIISLFQVSDSCYIGIMQGYVQYSLMLQWYHYFLLFQSPDSIYSMIINLNQGACQCYQNHTTSVTQTKDKSSLSTL